MAANRRRGDETLRRIEAASLIENSSQAIVAVDLQGRITDWNQAAAELHGYSRQQMLGQPYLNLIPKRLQGEYHTAIGKLRHKRKLPKWTSFRLHADGHEMPVEVMLYPLGTAEQDLVGFICQSTDVSGQMALEDELRHQARQTQAIVQTVIDGIATIDARGIITSVNPSIEKMFGYRGHEMLGRNVNMLMPEPYHSEHDDYIRAYLETGEAKIIGIGREVTARRRDGSIFPMELAVTQSGEGDDISFVGVLRDITERKEAEKAIQAVNTQLQNKVTELALAVDRLQKTQAQLVESEKLASLGGLVAGVAHEINTPLGVCVTAASFVTNNARELRQCLRPGAPDPDKLAQVLDSMDEASLLLERNLERAADLVSSFKQVAADRSSNLDRRFKLAEFLKELLDSLSPEIRRSKHQIEVACDPDLEMHSMPGALSQVLSNLLQNALIHAFADGAVGHVRIEASARDEHLILRVSDDGCGISPENLKQIFEPFFTTRRGKGGTGLGLSVTHNLVTQVLKGEIHAESQPGEGSCFELNLPLHLSEDD